VSFSFLPPLLATALLRLVATLDPRNAWRVPVLLVGALFAAGRRTVTAWFRACGITDDFRPAYSAIHSVGRRVDVCAVSVLGALEGLVEGDELTVILDDTPTARYGPCIDGAGIHHNPTPGPAGERFVYGHVWVTLALLVVHPLFGPLALPLLSRLYIRQKDHPKLLPDYRERHPFRTKLELAGELLRWLAKWKGRRFVRVRVLCDGAYAKRPLLRLARQLGFIVVSRLPRNAALCSLPGPAPAGRRGRRPTYGKARYDLAKRAGQRRGWHAVDCIQYGARQRKRTKTFLATWRPAGGPIRVVLVDEADGWRAYFSTDVDATPADVLEAAAERGTIEQLFRDVKEVWRAAEQQVRNLWANIGCWHVNGWMYSLVELWAWGREEDLLVDRSASPWDREYRRPSHADKRKALQREMLWAEIEALLAGEPTPQEIRDLTARLLQRAA
jgi:hypothetical protein